jgi:para-nitrobenzyl esterase
MRAWKVLGLAQGALIISLACVVIAQAQQVNIDSGAIEGKSDGDVRIFLGIPYAAPPLGELRWKPPAPVAKWTGVKKTTEFGYHCMQGVLFPDIILRDPGPSEDCLTLNVWTSAKSADVKLPVMVWIHGGAFKVAGSSEARDDGSVLAKRGVVIVSMNYRMGIFGFLVLPELMEESGRNAAGNYGLLDQVAALEWVKRNIAAFGGDQGNVTIFGESAGSVAVSTMMASPVAKGLFHKAIGESGGAFYVDGLSYEPLASRAQSDLQFVTSVLHAPTLKELRALPADKLEDLSFKAKGPDGKARFFPNMDGYFLPQIPPAIFAAGKQNDVPLMAGWNRDEASFELLMTPKAMAVLTANLTAKKQFGSKAGEFLRLYPATNNDVAMRSLIDLAGDRFIVWSTWSWLEAQLATGKQPVYRFRFDLAPPDAFGNRAEEGAMHAL